MSITRASDLHVAVQRALEHAHNRSVCDICLAYMVAHRPATVSSLITALARTRSDIVRRAGECAGCLRRKVVTLLKL
jgi:hypothetical protein